MKTPAGPWPGPASDRGSTRRSSHEWTSCRARPDGERVAGVVRCVPGLIDPRHYSFAPGSLHSVTALSLPLLSGRARAALVGARPSPARAYSRFSRWLRKGPPSCGATEAASQPIDAMMCSAVSKVPTNARRPAGRRSRAPSAMGRIPGEIKAREDPTQGQACRGSDSHDSIATSCTAPGVWP